MIFDPYRDAYAEEFCGDDKWDDEDELFMLAQEAQEAREQAENGAAS